MEENYRDTGYHPLVGDANYSGAVTGQDLVAVQQHYGSALAETTTSIPEPAAGLLLLAAGALAQRRRAAH